MHSRLCKSADTDPALIKAFKDKTKMVHCPSYNCTMSVKACRERRKRALLVKRLVQVSWSGNKMAAVKWMEMQHCTKCPGI